MVSHKIKKIMVSLSKHPQKKIRESSEKVDVSSFLEKIIGLRSSENECVETNLVGNHENVEKKKLLQVR